MQNRGHIWLHWLEWALPVTAFENPGHPRFGALRERQCSGGVRPVGPCVVQFRVRFRQGGFGKTEDIEQFARLLRVALTGGHGKQLALRSTERIDAQRGGLSGRAQAEASESVAVEFAVFV